MPRKIYICDLNTMKDNGILYCTARDLENGELIISADLKYIMQAVKERGYEIHEPEDILHKISQNFKFYRS